MGFTRYAMEYNSFGWNVLPIHPAGSSGSDGKNKPAFPWAKYEETKQNRETVDRWCQEFGNFNVAIITGHVSGLIVVDFDSKDAYANFVMDHNVPPTWRVETSKGCHLYFKLDPAKDISSYVAILPGVDIRANGGYVVAPDSSHKTGHVYTWMRESDAIALCPEFVYDLIENRKKKKSKEETEESWVAEALKGVSEGGRNATCARLAGYFFKRKMKPSEVLAMISAWNAKNVPPMPDGELRATVESIFDKNAAASLKPAEKEPEQESEFQSDAPELPLLMAKRIISKWIYYKDDTLIDLAIATAAAAVTTQEPIWIAIVGGSSTGKTELLRAFDKYPNHKFMDKVTAPAFATGFNKAKGLLETHNGRKMLLAVQDLSTIFAKTSGVDEVLDVLRQIYNGRVNFKWGSGKEVNWEGKFNCLAGTTPEIESKSMSELGERFLYYRVDSNDSITRQGAIEKTRITFGKEAEARAEIIQAVHGVLNKIKARDVKAVVIPEAIRTQAERVADVITILRTPVKRHEYNQDQVLYEPAYEGAPRMLKMLMNIMQALACVREKTECNEEELAVVVKVGLDSLPSVRRRVLRSVISLKGQGFLRASDFAENCSYVSEKHAMNNLEDLAALGVMDKKYERVTPSSFSSAPLAVKSQPLFNLSIKFFEMMHHAGIVEVL